MRGKTVTLKKSVGKKVGTKRANIKRAVGEADVTKVADIGKDVVKAELSQAKKALTAELRAEAKRKRFAKIVDNPTDEKELLEQAAMLDADAGMLVDMLADEEAPDTSKSRNKRRLLQKDLRAILDSIPWKTIKSMGFEALFYLRTVIRTYLRTYQFQLKTRCACCHRLGIKANGEDAKIPDGQVRHLLLPADRAEMLQYLAQLMKDEQRLYAILESLVSQVPLYTHYLSKIDAVGVVTAAWIISAFDIYKADRPSQMWSYAGMNPGLVRGWKAEKSGGVVVINDLGEEEWKPRGEVKWQITDTLIRGDRQTRGHRCPYNKRLRTGLMISGKSQMMHGSQYYWEFGRGYKQRLCNSENVTKETTKGGGTKDVMWKDATPRHRDDAARRYLVKMFILDIWHVWRRIEDLVIAKSYQEEYLGKPHHYWSKIPGRTE